MGTLSSLVTSNRCYIEMKGRGEWFRINFKRVVQFCNHQSKNLNSSPLDCRYQPSQKAPCIESNMEINVAKEEAFGNESGKPGKNNVVEDAISGDCRVIMIPEKWGMEDSLKEWVGCSTLDTFLASKDVAGARKALAAEARKRRVHYNVDHTCPNTEYP